MSDFFDTLGYEIPEDTPKNVEAEGFQYYRHPMGLYMGFVGKIIAKYKDSEGHRCEREAIDAKFNNYSLPIWIIKSLGNLENPLDETLIHPETLTLPPRPTAEIYFPIFISATPKDQWTLKKMFENWKIPGHNKYDIIAPSPANPANTMTSFASFPAYYGLSVKFFLTAKDPAKSRYVDGGIEIISYEKRIPMETLKIFEEAVNDKLEKERKDRQAQSGNNSSYQPEDAPKTDFDSLGGNEDETVNDFLK